MTKLQQESIAEASEASESIESNESKESECPKVELGKDEYGRPLYKGDIVTHNNDKNSYFEVLDKKSLTKGEVRLLSIDKKTLKYRTGLCISIANNLNKEPLLNDEAVIGFDKRHEPIRKNDTVVTSCGIYKVIGISSWSKDGSNSFINFI